MKITKRKGPREEDCIKQEHPSSLLIVIYLGIGSMRFIMFTTSVVKHIFGTCSTLSVWTFLNIHVTYAQTLHKNTLRIIKRNL